MSTNSRTQTSTQIRTLYSEGMSCINVKFFNTNLSFSFYPFLSRDGNGISKYDTKNGQQTTVNYEGAYALYKMATDIIEGKVTECDLPIPCLAGAVVTLKREVGSDGRFQTTFNITKNNMTIPFKFQVSECTTRVNGQVVNTVIESGLGAFQKTIDGYLTGINADRHLNKLTDEYAALQNQNQSQSNNQSQQNSYNGNGYNKYQNNSGNYKKPYNGNNNGNFKKYNNGYQQNNQQNNWNKQQTNMSSYNIPN